MNRRDKEGNPRPRTLGARFRHWARDKFFDFARKAARTDDARTIFSDMLRAEIGASALSSVPVRATQPEPYADLGRYEGDASNRNCLRPTPIFVTGRFRSGSTLFWNLFRNLPNTTAYYEPHNERRWFDPSTRGGHTDPTHLNVENYWAEYDGLEELGKYYREEWIDKQLFMSERSWDPDMKRYIEILIAKAKGRAVLQFNHVDLRLPWLRVNFPDAKLLHIYRHPRDQWNSTLRGFNGDMKKLNVAEFRASDGFYLLSWARDLRHYFPFIDTAPHVHPYELFFLIWRLSYLFGRQYADVSVGYEEILATPAERIDRVLRELGITDFDIDRLATLVTPMEMGKWKRWGCDSLFTEIEARVDCTLTKYLGERVAVSS